MEGAQEVKNPVTVRRPPLQDEQVGIQPHGLEVAALGFRRWGLGFRGCGFRV